MSRRGNYKKKIKNNYLINIDNLDGTIKDLNGNPFTNVGGVTTSIAYSPYYAIDVMTTSKYLNFGNDSKYQIYGDEPRTIALWFNSALSGTNNYMMMSDWWVDGGGWRFGPNYYNQVSFDLYTTSSVNQGRLVIKGDRGFMDSTWHHIIGTYDGSYTKEGLNLYIDGFLDVGSYVERTQRGTAYTGATASYNFYVGKSNTAFEGKTSLHKFMKGEYTAAQALSLFNLEKGYFGL